MAGDEPWSEPQNLGEGFQFEEDEEALQSILENRGLARTQGPAESGPKRGLVPAEAAPTNFQGADQLEFFQSANGKVFFRKKFISPRGKFVLTNSSTPSMQPVRNLSAKPSPSTNTPDCPVSAKEYLQPTWRRPGGGQTNSEQKRPGGGMLIPPPHRQSISERKAPPGRPVSQLPQPAGCLAKKSLVFAAGGGTHQTTTRTNAEFKRPLPPVSTATLENPPLPPLTQLTRESMQYLPRESLAWLAQLPRESATYAELQDLMGEGDRELMNEDDTQSFEALELRLRTPMRAVAKSRLAVDRSDDEAMLTPSSLLGTPASDRQASPMKISGFQAVLNSGPSTIVEELVNLPADPILSTPPVKSKSYSNLHSGLDVPVLRSRSEENLNNVVQLSELVCSERLEQVLKDLEHYRQEQNELERQQKELAEKIRQRKAEFKALWGLSPLSINQARTARRPPPPSSILADITNIAAAEAMRTSLVHEDDNDQENRCPPRDLEDARRVRFNSGDNVEKYLTPNSSFQTTPASLAPSTNTSFSNQSFASLKSSFSFLQTPRVPVAKKRFTQRLEEEDEEEENSVHNLEGGKLGVPTPVALRCLSNRVKEEFARLYADSSDESDEWSGSIAPKINYNVWNT